jgi:hypothetical protein
MSQPPAVADGTGEQIGPDLLPASQTVQPSADPREDLLRKTVRREFAACPASGAPPVAASKNSSNPPATSDPFHSR